MVDNDIIKEWITKADQDFEFARINLEEEKQFFAQICFHFNQSAEKYLKAFIIANSLEFRKIHDLHLLLKQCKSKDPSFFPVHWPTIFSKKEAEKAHKAAKSIRNFLKKKLQKSES